MTTQDSPRDSVNALAEAAGAFQRAAQTPGSHLAAPETLASLQESLQVLSGAWYGVAADAASGIAVRTAGEGTSRRRDGLSREQEVRLMGALHDVAAAFARCARACREAQSTVTPIVARSAGGRQADAARRDGELAWFQPVLP